MESWYSPPFVLLAADQAVTYCLEHDLPRSDLERVSGEARAAAFFALGLSATLGKETWMQLVDPTEQAPDCRVMYLDEVENSNHLNTIDVEVATFNPHSKDSLAGFLLRTKLDGKHAYSASTVIVIYVRRSTTPEQLREAHTALGAVGPKGLVYLVGQVDEDLFQVVQLHPRFAGPVDVRISEALERPQLPVADVTRGMAKGGKRSAMPLPTANPFLVLLGWQAPF